MPSSKHAHHNISKVLERTRTYAILSYIPLQNEWASQDTSHSHFTQLSSMSAICLMCVKEMWKWDWLEVRSTNSEYKQKAILCLLTSCCRLPSNRKRIVVPFRAAQTPAESSEYSQPDMALLLTHLSYYRNGLSKKDLLIALKMLQSMGENTQAAEYKLWLERSTDSMDPGINCVTPFNLCH